MAAGQSRCTGCLLPMELGSRSYDCAMAWAGVWVKGSCSSIGAVALEENGPRVAKEEVLSEGGKRPLCLAKEILLQAENKAAEVKGQDVEDCLAQGRKKPSNCYVWEVLWGTAQGDSGQTKDHKAEDSPGGSGTA